VTNGLDTLLTGLHVEIDDHVVPARRAVADVPDSATPSWCVWPWHKCLLGFHFEHRWIRFAQCRLGHLFRYLPSSPTTTSGCATRSERATMLGGRERHPPQS